MKNFTGWAWSHFMIAVPTILVIAFLKFIFDHNAYLRTYRNDF